MLLVSYSHHKEKDLQEMCYMAVFLMVSVSHDILDEIAASMLINQNYES